MLNVETMLMDSILKFAIIDIPKMGVEEAAVYCAAPSIPSCAGFRMSSI